MATSCPSSADQAAFDFLFSRINYERRAEVPYRPREYKLDRMRELLTRLGNPQQSLPIIHIAGTKGKGSTAAFISSILSATDQRVGVFSSPHLDRIEERMAINGTACKSKTLASLIDQLRPIVTTMDAEAEQRGEIGPTYFELTTALALMHFATTGVDLAVLEVGLGGRLDSTNVCQPICCAITSISYDHMQQLGNTLSDIAGEKAGIIKPGVPVISGVADEEPRDVIRQIAKERGAELREIDRDFTIEYRAPCGDPEDRLGNICFSDSAMAERLEDATIGLLGAHQARNAAVALACVGQLRKDGWSIPAAAVREGLRSARCRARIEVLSSKPDIVVDAAHNVASAQALIEVLRESFRPTSRTLVFATTREKDARGMFEVLLPEFDRVIVTRYLENPRAVPPEELAKIARELGTNPIEIAPDPATTWHQVASELKNEHLACVTGSFFIAAEMRREISEAGQQTQQTTR